MTTPRAAFVHRPVPVIGPAGGKNRRPGPINGQVVGSVLPCLSRALVRAVCCEGGPDQPPRVKTLFRVEAPSQSFFSSAVILRDLTTTALCLPSVPFGAGPVTVSGTNQ